MRGYSLLELIVVTLLFTGLTAVLTLAWTRGARSITYSDKVVARLNQLTLVRHRIERELAETHTLSLQIRPTLFTFSLQQDDYYQHFDQWPVLAYYYLEADKLYRRQLPAPLHPPLEAYAHDGKELVAGLTSFSISQDESLVRIHLESGRFKLDSTTRVRN